MIVPPPPVPIPQDFYGVFAGPINEISFQKFCNTFTMVTQQKLPNKRLHLLIQSTGGIIGDGIALYNLLRKAPFDLCVYNSGSIQSIATVCFLAAPRRIANSNA